MLKRSIRKMAAPAVHLETLETRQMMTANAWKSAVNGSWTDASKWSLGHVPTKTEDVVISAAGTYAVTLGDCKTVTNLVSNKLTVGGGSGTQTLNISSAAVLTSSGTLNVLAGDTLNLNGGNFYTYAVKGTAGTLDGTVNVNGVFNDVADLNLGGTTYSGSGTINANNTGGPAYQLASSIRAYGAMLGTGITLRGTTADVYGDITNNGKTIVDGDGLSKWFVRNFTNKGTFTSALGATLLMENFNNAVTGKTAITGGNIKFAKTYTNTGSVTATNALLDYNMDIVGTPGKLTRVNSPVKFTGTYDAKGKTFTFDTSGRWLWAGGQLQNGNYDPTRADTLLLDNSQLASNGRLSKVSLTGDLSIPAGTAVSAYGDLTLSGANRKILLNGSIAKGAATLNVYGSQITGNGEVVFNTDAGAALNRISGNGFTIGSGITVRGYSGTLGGGLTNNGTVLADTAGQNFVITDIVNNGNLISAPGTMTIYRFTQKPAGQLTVGIGGYDAGQYGQFKFADPTYASVFDGTLNAVFVNNFVPITLGDTFDIATIAKPATGVFSTLNLDAGNGIAFDLTSTASALTLTSKISTNFASRDGNGKLTGYGTSGNDTITTKTSLGVTAFTVNGKTSVFYDRAITSASINAGDGNDKVTLSGPRGWTVLGGVGNDTLCGGGGADSLYGEAGKDTVYGAGDNVKDLLDGGADADVKGSADAIDTIVSL